MTTRVSDYETNDPAFKSLNKPGGIAAFIVTALTSGEAAQSWQKVASR